MLQIRQWNIRRLQLLDGRLFRILQIRRSIVLYILQLGGRLFRILQIRWLIDTKHLQ